MLWFIIGLFVGAFFTTGFMALIYASGNQSEEEYRRERSRMMKKNKSDSDAEKDETDS